MDAGEFDEIEFFRAIADSHARVLLIGRKALIVLGLPVGTHDYDFWVHADDVEALNSALEPLEHFPSCTPAEARARGRYVLENGEHIDVLITRARSTLKGETLTFDDAWARRDSIEVASGVGVAIPCLDDLIVTKEWAMRAKDIGDIQMLEALRAARRTQ